MRSLSDIQSQNNQVAQSEAKDILNTLGTVSFNIERRLQTAVSQGRTADAGHYTAAATLVGNALLQLKNVGRGEQVSPEHDDERERVA